MNNNTLDHYKGLITSEHADKPNFMAMIEAMLTPSVRIQDLLDSMIALFDLATPPVGQQLDVIGQWVGVSRDVVIPITGVLFSWDDLVNNNGWDFGIWSSDDNPVTVNVLPDDAYLTLIKAKIAANHWDGTTEGAYKIWTTLFPSLVLLIQDEQDMTFNIGIIGVMDALTYALLTQGYLPLRPEGIRIGEYYTQKDTNPFFGWDVSTPYVDGWGTGSWPIVTPGS